MPPPTGGVGKQLWIGATSELLGHCAIFRGYYYEFKFPPVGTLHCYVFAFVADRLIIQLVAKKSIKGHNIGITLLTMTQAPVDGNTRNVA
jgi:hypothetical protein